MIKACLPGVLAIIFLSVICHGETIHIPADYPTVQEGIDAAVDGDTVLLADGTFFIFNEPLNTRGKAIHLVSEHGPEHTVLRYDELNFERMLVIDSGEDENTLIEGITFGNRSSGFKLGASAGILIQDTSPVFIRCIVNNNFCYHDYGGGVHCINSNARFESCEFKTCAAVNGGGFCASESSDVSLVDCLFKKNRTASSTTFCQGGGAYARMSSSIEISGCEFRENFSDVGGGLACDETSQTRVDTSLFVANRAYRYGGAIYLEMTDAEHTNCIIGADNRFEDNEGLPGADLYCTAIPENPIYARSNSFSGNFRSHVYVCPPEAFDLAGSVGEIAPIYQDVFVDDDGNNNNDGLTPDTPFRSIYYAVCRVVGTKEKPVKVRVAPGEFTNYENEPFPLTLSSYVSLSGDCDSPPILNAEDADVALYTHFASHQSIEHIHVKNSREVGIHIYSAENVTISNCDIMNTSLGIISNGTGVRFESCRIHDNGSMGILVEQAGSVSIHHCNIHDNQTAILARDLTTVYIESSRLHDNFNTDFPGGLYLGPDSNLTVVNSYIYRNSNNNTMSSGYSGGGLYLANNSSSELFNTVIADNYGYSGGAVTIAELASARFTNCTIIDNRAAHRESVGGIYLDGYAHSVMLVNSILWRNSGNQYGGYPLFVCSVVQDGDTNNGNLNSDPCLLPGPWRSGFLCHTDAGQPVDSPCIDAGFALAEDICFDTPDGTLCLSELTTRSDGQVDTGQADIGAHMEQVNEYPVTDILLNQEVYSAGDPFTLVLEIDNPGEALYDVPIYVMFEVAGEFWCWPEWSSNSYAMRTLPAQNTFREVILDFTWPDTLGVNGYGRFWAAGYSNQQNQYVTSSDIVEFRY